MMFKNLKKALEEREKVTTLKITIKDKSLPEELFHFPLLKELYLEAPNLAEMPAEVSAWARLTLIQIKAPAFKGTLSQLFRLPMLCNLKTIETPLHPLRLPLGGSRAPVRFLTLKDATLKELPSEFGELASIEELHLPGNQLSNLPDTFSQLKRLKWINLDSNDFVKFPAILAKLSQLKHLSLDNNPFPEEEKERIQREHNLTVT